MVSGENISAVKPRDIPRAFAIIGLDECLYASLMARLLSCVSLRYVL
jgi:hypothetical protein